MILTYGKYSGRDIRDVPRDYLEWLVESSRKTAEAISAELERRDLMEMADAGWAEKIIRTGFRALAMQHHPDKGGETADMRHLLAAYEQLKESLAAPAKPEAAVRKPAARSQTAA